MVAIMGTSTCHVMNGDAARRGARHVRRRRRRHRRRACWGYEAGQSGVGDIFAWFVETRAADYAEQAAARGLELHELADRRWPPSNRSARTAWSRSTGGAATVRCSSTTSCPACIVGLTLATRPEDIYRALLEATAFGTRMIIEAFETAGVPVDELVVAGGLTRNRLLMQIYTDVTRLPLSVVGSSQGPALGSAIHAAVAAGAYPDVTTAAAAMGRRDIGVYQPDQDRSQAYDECVRGVSHVARLVRPWRQRRDAPVAGDPTRAWPDTPGRRR